MARIRSVKPSFWSDEKLAPMRPLERLVFLGLISMADDAGRLVDNVKSIDGFLFPDTDDTAREALDVLAAAGRILRYTAPSGQRLIQLAGWAKHQKVDNPAKQVLPPPPGFAAPCDAREDLARPTRDPVETLAVEAEAGSRKREVGSGADARANGAAPPAAPAPLRSDREGDPLGEPHLAALVERLRRERYGGATPERWADVRRQLGELLAPEGTRDDRGAVVRATPAILARAHAARGARGRAARRRGGVPVTAPNLSDPRIPAHIGGVARRHLAEQLATQDAAAAAARRAQLPPEDDGRLEKAEQLACVRIVRALGGKAYNLSQARRSKQTPGLPDLWCVFFAHALAFWWETKRPGGGRRAALGGAGGVRRRVRGLPRRPRHRGRAGARRLPDRAGRVHLRRARGARARASARCYG
jgi:hypothetical protein